MNEFYIHLRIFNKLHRDSLLLEPKVIIFRAIKLSSLAVNIFELMIDRRHPDGGLRLLISCLFEMLYPSFSFFVFRFKISVFRSCMRKNELNMRCYPGDFSAACLFCRDAL